MCSRPERVCRDETNARRSKQTNNLAASAHADHGFVVQQWHITPNGGFVIGQQFMSVTISNTTS
jgi:hypothetical protein